MEPYLTGYLPLSVRALESMLAMRTIIASAHKDKREGEIRLAALEEALRQAKIREAAEEKRQRQKDEDKKAKRSRSQN